MDSGGNGIAAMRRAVNAFFRATWFDSKYPHQWRIYLMQKEIKEEPRCFKCDKEIESAGKGESPWEMASGAVIMDGGGSFGSTLYDSLCDGISVQILVCDDCLKQYKYKIKEIRRRFNGGQ